VFAAIIQPLIRTETKKVCLALLLMKIGFIIPLFTSELESSLYISYMTWFLSGLFVSILMQPKKEFEDTRKQDIPYKLRD